MKAFLRVGGLLKNKPKRKYFLVMPDCNPNTGRFTERGKRALEEIETCYHPQSGTDYRRLVLGEWCDS